VQSAFVEHDPRHAPAVHDAYAPHVRAPCGAPDATFTQLPTEPATSHAWQLLVHEALQHTPSTQLPAAHWRAEVHALPLASDVVHVPDEQYVPAMQSESTEHVARHAPAEHVSEPLQAARVPCGEPTTFVQVPSEPVTSHAWHCEVHDVEQQYPSTQLPLRP
jgi:hypothetical protein